MELTLKELEQIRQALRDCIQLRETHLKLVKPHGDQSVKRRQATMQRVLPIARSALAKVTMEISRLKRETP